MVTTDQLRRTISISDQPVKIVSLVPSQTELLFDIGLRDEVIAITKFCIHPSEWFHTKTRIGGTKKLDIEKIRSLSPDLIIANKEENEEDQINRLMEEFPVWVSDIHSLNDAYEMISEISRIVNKELNGKKLVDEIRSEFERFSSLYLQPLSCIYLIWKNPIMTVGGDTFISEILRIAGFRNVFESSLRYPEITPEDLQKSVPDVILLSSEPFPFNDKHAAELKQYVPDAKIFLADGEMFSWYGSRLLKAPSYFLKLREKIETGL